MSDPYYHTAFLCEWKSLLASCFQFWCPGCDEMHVFTVRRDEARPAWTFDGNYQKPSFSPSLLYPDKKVRCHLYLKEGKIQFLDDCGHALAGQTVDMVELPRE